MKTVSVISGKGGTGKTSLVAAFADIWKPLVVADCDVDAADLHLILAPEIIQMDDFSGGKTAVIDPEFCRGCGTCFDVCRYGAILPLHKANRFSENIYEINSLSCEGCGVCHWNCPYQAIIFEDENNGKWFVSRTRTGPMVHAELIPGAENSGKLVTLVRQKAESVAQEKKLNLILVDGSPGIGCPVIASLTGADLAIVVTEPTLSGLHDCKRVIALSLQMSIPIAVIINKWDINPEITQQINGFLDTVDCVYKGCISYDTMITKAQIQRKSITELPESRVSSEIKEISNALNLILNEHS
ncbi:ATP-binding protein [bacterium]|nr:ATP-binding protein [candidate division CSSED10-310 bacterium]